MTSVSSGAPTCEGRWTLPEAASAAAADCFWLSLLLLDVFEDLLVLAAFSRQLCLLGLDPETRWEWGIRFGGDDRCRRTVCGGSSCLLSMATFKGSEVNLEAFLASSWHGEGETELFGDCSTLLGVVTFCDELHLEFGYVDSDEHGVDAGEKTRRTSAMCSSILSIFCLRLSISSLISILISYNVARRCCSTAVRQPGKEAGVAVATDVLFVLLLLQLTLLLAMLLILFILKLACVVGLLLSNDTSSPT